MKRYSILIALTVVVLAGCTGPDETSHLVPAGAKPVKPHVPAAEAGTLVPPSDPKLYEQAKAYPVAARGNPFSLSGVEVAYDRAQLAASINESSGWYGNIAEPKEENTQPTFQSVLEPDRRLAGVLIGESISALIDMNDGKGLQVIRPGSQLVGASGQPEWVVVSIDEEKAILKRINPNIHPQTVVVRLQTDLGNGGTGGGGGGQQGGGGGQRGNPGGGPGSVRND
jgi:hypothetical protein